MSTQTDAEELRQLTLTDDEDRYLAELLDRSLGQLYAEISHTDNPRFRAGLRQERAALMSVRAKLRH